MIMVKKIQLFITFLLFTACLSLQANTTPTEPVGNPVTGNPQEDICALASPDAVLVVGLGPNWAKIIWTPVAGAAQYHVITRDANTNAVYNDVYAPPAANNGFTISPLPPGSTCITEVRSVCANGEEVVPGTKSFPYGLIVLDIVTVGYDGVPAGNILGCTVNTSTGCTMPMTGIKHYFRISNRINGQYIDFAAYKDPNEYKLNIVANPSGNSAYTFTDNNDGLAQIYYNSGEFNYCAAELVMIGTPTNSSLAQYTNGCGGAEFIVKKYVPGAPVNNDGADDSPNNHLTDILKTPITAAPNPFTNLLDVKIPFGAEENDILISLYDLEGRQVLSVQSPGGPQIRSLSTDDLLPGLYLLQVKTGDRIETIKVVKTQ